MSSRYKINVNKERSIFKALGRNGEVEPRVSGGTSKVISWIMHPMCKFLKDSEKQKDTLKRAQKLTWWQKICSIGRNKYLNLYIELDYSFFSLFRKERTIYSKNIIFEKVENITWKLEFHMLLWRIKIVEIVFSVFVLNVKRKFSPMQWFFPMLSN